MRKGVILAVLAALMVLAVVFSSCQSISSPQPAEEVNQATRSAAATAQAQMNLLQVEAFELERKLDENFSEHYVGINTESYPSLKVVVYLTGASKADLAPFVQDPALFEVIEVREEAISRQFLRETRELFKADMDEVGVTYTTAIKMEPARLQVYVYDIPEAQDKLNAAGVSIPEHVEFVQMENLPEGG
jgi:hypothetical protein